MREIWDDSCKFSIWLEIEILACEAMAQLGLIPEADARAIRARGKIFAFLRFSRLRNEPITT